jgi:hypothetical protein
VVRGWVKAYAPAFEDGDVTSVLAATAGCGFREGISLMLVQGWWQDAWERWRRCRQRAHHGYRDR